MADHPVASVSQPSIRMAPTIVRFSPQFIGRGSISSVPRGSHACDRPIARFAPDSSRKTRRRGSTVAAQSWKRARCSWTPHDRAPPAAIVFFEHVSRAVATRATRSSDARGPPCSAFVVRARQLLGGPVGMLFDERLQQREVDRRGPAAAFGQRLQRARRALAVHPAL